MRIKLHTTNVQEKFCGMNGKRSTFSNYLQWKLAGALRLFVRVNGGPGKIGLRVML